MFKKWLSKLFTIGRGENSSVTASDDLNWSPESVIPSPEDSQITEADFMEQRSESESD